MNRSVRRPIATVRLHTPIEHKGYTVACIEVPCPKPGRPYAAGLEHAELVVGTPADGLLGNSRLLSFVEACGQDPTLASLHAAFDRRALHKKLNADISVSFSNATHAATGSVTIGDVSVKFHQRPLYEVAAYEKAHGAVEPVPLGYFDRALVAEAQQKQEEKQAEPLLSPVDGRGVENSNGGGGEELPLRQMNELAAEQRQVLDRVTLHLQVNLSVEQQVSVFAHEDNTL